MELVLLRYKTWRRVGLVIQSLLLSTTHQLPNQPLTSLPNMPMTNSRTFQSASGLNTITRPAPKRSGGDYPSGQQVYHNKFGLLLMKTNLFRLDPWHGLHGPSLDPGVQNSWDGRLFVGASPFQSRGTWEAQGTRANRSSSTILVENHQDGGDWSWGRREDNGRFNSLHEAFVSHRNEVVEDVERGRESSEFLLVLLWLTSTSNIFLFRLIVLRARWGPNWISKRE